MSPPTNSVDFTTGKRRHDNVSTGDAMVQTEWRSPTGSALLVAVKLDLSSTQPQRPTSKSHRAQSQGSTKEKSSNSSSLY